MIHSDILFTDREHGWIITGGPQGPGAIFRTLDGGETWEDMARCSLNAIDHRFYGAFFLDSTTGWVCGEHGEGEDGVLWHTLDGGNSWEVWEAGAPGTGLPLSHPFFQICFCTRTRGFIISSGLPLLETDDGGRSWKASAEKDIFPFGLTFLPGGQRGFLLSQDLNPLTWQSMKTCHFATDDGGHTWTAIDDQFEGLEQGGVDIACCRFFNEMEGLLCGPEGVLYRTADAARTWQKVNHPCGTVDLNTMCVIPDGRAWLAGSNGVCASSTDYGRNWTRLYPPTESEILSVIFFVDGTGFIVGYNNLAVTTKDGGQTWESINLNAPQETRL